MKNGLPDFDFICGAQVKIRKVKTLDETGNFATGSGLNNHADSEDGL